jgi:hypothetical protein
MRTQPEDVPLTTYSCSVVVVKEGYYPTPAPGSPCAHGPASEPASPNLKGKALCFVFRNEVLAFPGYFNEDNQKTCTDPV